MPEKMAKYDFLLVQTQASVPPGKVLGIQPEAKNSSVLEMLTVKEMFQNFALELGCFSVLCPITVNSSPSLLVSSGWNTGGK